MYDINAFCNIRFRICVDKISKCYILRFFSIDHLSNCAEYDDQFNFPKKKFLSFIEFIFLIYEKYYKLNRRTLLASPHCSWEVGGGSAICNIYAF